MAEFATMSSGGFPYGLNWSKNPEAIADGELVQAENAEYDHADGSLRTVPGVTIKLDLGIPVETLFYDNRHNTFYFSSGTVLYRSADLKIYVRLGTVSGSSKPVYCMYGDVCLIATGGLLQVISGGNSLQTVSGSPLVNHYVTSRIGRVLTYSLTSDQLNYSAIGDYTSWQNIASDSSSAQFVNIGYKDPGNIISIDFLSKVIMVYKEGGRAYKIVGEPQDSNYAVESVSQTASCLSMNATINVDDKSYYLGQAGFMSFQPVNTYGNVAPFEEGLNINAWIVKNIDSNCQLWHVQPKKQIWLKTQNDKRIYMYHYIPRYSDGRGAFTVREFTNQINDVCCIGNTVYVAYGNKIGILDLSVDTDDGIQLQTAITGNNKLTQKHSILVMNRNFVTYNIIDGYGFIQCGKKPKNVIFSASSPDVYGNVDDIYGNKKFIYTDSYTRSYKVGGGSNKSVQLSILIQKGAVSIRQFDYQYLEV
jgi:hypothetical protein